MKIPKPSQRPQQGSALLVCLIIAAVLGVTLASYLLLTQANYQSVIRSQTWNQSMALTEAGVEDGLALINKNIGNFINLPTWTNSATSDSWTSVGNGTFHVRRSVGANGWGTNYYDVYITNAYGGPTISSVGVAAWNPLRASVSTQPLLAATGPNTETAAPAVQRRVAVTTKLDAMFAVAMAAVQPIDLKGNDISTDSFDSADPAHSINGLYPYSNPSMVNSNGDICTLATLTNSISGGNANIKGKLKTGPKGTAAIGSNGYVTGGVSDDFNVKFPDVILPVASWTPVAGTTITINGITYNQRILTSGDYVLNGLTKSLYIASNVVCRIRVIGDVSLTGNDEIRIAQGARVSMFMQAASFKLAGNGIVNNNGNADSFTYYGLPSNTTATFGGNGGFVGSIYAPQADFTLGGGGNEIKDFIGASVTKTVKMNGHFNFHYDENLRRVGPGRGYVPTGWKEVATN